jgi:alpha-galactosidase
MHKLIPAAMAVISLFFAASLPARNNDKAQCQDAVSWAERSFRKGSVPPFSFDYDGKPSDAFIRNWKYSKTASKEDVNSFRVEYKDPKTGLVAFCDVVAYPDFNAVEWTLRFRNDGNADSQNINNVKALNIKYGSGNGYFLNHLNGSSGAMNDFAPAYDSIEYGKPLTFNPAGGRSSSGAFPFFNLMAPSGDNGAVISIGWSGSWKAEFSSSEKQGLKINAGLMNFDAFLHAGETVRMPLVSIMFWAGKDEAMGSTESGLPMNMTGNNKFRRFVLAHHSRKVDGRLLDGPLCGGLNWGDPEPLNEYTGMTADYAKFLIDRYYEFDIFPDAFWLDAGWYKNSADWKNECNWYNTVGSWTEDSERFPSTLREISDHAHKRGREYAERTRQNGLGKFMVWFEPERVYEGSDIFREHHDWLLTLKDSHQGLLNLGNEDALQWLCSYIGDFLESRGIDYYRQDFNVNPDAFWNAADSAGRHGITEVKYIEGLYEYWDYLLNHFPNMMIDNCASGGRRLDLETIGRSMPLWRTDYSYGEVNGYQNQTYGLEFFLPLHGTGIYKEDKFSARSAYSSAMVMNFKLTDKNFSFFRMKDVYDEYRAVKPYFLEDYYPLCGVNDLTALDRWIAYELFRPSDGTGYVLAFRRKDNKDSEYKVCLKGLDPDKTYSLKNMDSGEEVSRSGRELASGFALSLPEPASSLLLRIQVTGK